MPEIISRHEAKSLRLLPSGPDLVRIASFHEVPGKPIVYRPRKEKARDLFIFSLPSHSPEISKTSYPYFTVHPRAGLFFHDLKIYTPQLLAERCLHFSASSSENSKREKGKTKPHQEKFTPKKNYSGIFFLLPCILLEKHLISKGRNPCFESSLQPFTF